ncbi:MAG: SufE family protein [Chloroflexota bacterium]
MTDYPGRLNEVLADFAFVTSRSERAELLMDWADRFTPVPADIAAPPYPADHRVPFCESDAYVWTIPEGNGSLCLYFAIENPQGLSAMALAAILTESLSGLPAAWIATVTPDIVLKLFGNDISMGKGQGLMGMVTMVQAAAKAHRQG